MSFNTILLLGTAIAFIWRIHVERQDEKRELIERRTRLHQGGLL